MEKVHRHKNVWWFWDGTKKNRRRIGSYTSKVGAEAGLEIWEQNKIEKITELPTIDELTALTKNDVDNLSNECKIA